MSARIAAAALVAAARAITASGGRSTPTATAPSTSVAFAASPSLDRTGALHVTKNCATYHGLAGQSCTITATNLAAIEGATIIYASGAVGTSLDTDISLVAPGSGNRAVGHCVVDLGTGVGECRLTGGTGTLAGLRAKAAVSYVGGPDGFDFAWDGRYHFTGRDGGD